MLPMQSNKQPSMPEADTDLGDASMMEEPDEQPSPDGAGYMIAWKVKPDGSMSVCQKPLPPEDDAEQSAYREIPVKNEEQALKAALKIYQENPMSGDEQAGFDAGFASKPESVPGRGMSY